VNKYKRYVYVQSAISPITPKKMMVILLVSLVSSCASYTKNFVSEQTEQIFTPYYLVHFSEGSFKISIEAFDNHFGGILVAKKLETNHYRFAFINEFGGKLLDFELIDRKLKLNYAIEQLDRKIILNMLEKDFAILFSEENRIDEKFSKENSTLWKSPEFAGKKNLYYKFDSGEKLDKIILANRKEKVSIELKASENDFPEFEISHGKLPIKISLHLLANQ